MRPTRWPSRVSKLFSTSSGRWLVARAWFCDGGSGQRDSSQQDDIQLGVGLPPECTQRVECRLLGLLPMLHHPMLCCTALCFPPPTLMSVDSTRLERRNWAVGPSGRCTSSRPLICLRSSLNTWQGRGNGFEGRSSWRAGCSIIYRHARDAGQPQAARITAGRSSHLHPTSAFQGYFKTTSVLLAHHQVGELPVLGILHNLLQRVALPLVVRGARQHLRGAYGRG